MRLIYSDLVPTHTFFGSSIKTAEKRIFQHFFTFPKFLKIPQMLFLLLSLFLFFTHNQSYQPTAVKASAIAELLHGKESIGITKAKYMNLLKDGLVMFLDVIDADHDGNMTKEEVDQLINQLEQGTSTAISASSKNVMELLHMLQILLDKQHLHSTKPPSPSKMDKRTALEEVRTGMHSLLKLGDIDKDGKITRQEVEKAISVLANGSACANTACWNVTGWKLCEQMAGMQEKCEADSTKEVCKEESKRDVKAKMGSNKTEILAEVKEQSEKVCTKVGSAKKCTRKSKLAVDLCTEAAGKKKECARVRSKKTCMQACKKVGPKQVCKQVCTASQQGCKQKAMLEALEGALQIIKAGLDGFGF